MTPSSPRANSAAALAIIATAALMAMKAPNDAPMKGPIRSIETTSIDVARHLVIATRLATTTAFAAAPSRPTTLQVAIDEGAKLFVAYNCADCHGAGGSGAMGPSFVDNRWRFGGSNADVYKSIAEGRPEGMPAWGPMIPRDQIEKLVAYVQSLGARKDLSTENFTGATVDRAGH